MRFQRTFLRASALAAMAALSAAFTGCSSGTTTPATQNAAIRIVNGSPGAGAGTVDVYVYTGTAIPSTPSFVATYPSVSPYGFYPQGSYTVSVFAHGAATSGVPLVTQSFTAGPNVRYSFAVAGDDAGTTAPQFVNFIEPTTAAGIKALVVHHASPYLASLYSASTGVGVGVYDATVNPVTPPSTVPQLFNFQLAPTSGPALNASVAGGEWYGASSSYPTLSTSGDALGFVVGPATTNGGNISSIVVAQTLASIFAAGLPASGHESLFLIDTATSAEFIGAPDP